MKPWKVEIQVYVDPGPHLLARQGWVHLWYCLNFVFSSITWRSELQKLSDTKTIAKIMIYSPSEVLGPSTVQCGSQNLMQLNASLYQLLMMREGGLKAFLVSYIPHQVRFRIIKTTNKADESSSSSGTGSRPGSVLKMVEGIGNLKNKRLYDWNLVLENLESWDLVSFAFIFCGTVLLHVR